MVGPYRVRLHAGFLLAATLTPFCRMKTNTIPHPRSAWRPLVAATVFVSGLASALWSADGGSKPAWLSDLSVTAAQSYNSNVYGAEVSVPGFDPVADVGSWVTTLSPKVTFDLKSALGIGDDGAISAFKVGYAGEYAFYWDDDAEDESHERHTITFALKTKSGAWSTTWDNAFLWVDGSESTPRYLRNSAYGNAMARERREQFQDRAKFGIRYDDDQWFLRAVGNLLHYDLHTDHHVATGAYRGWQNFIDRHDANVGLDFGYKVQKDWAMTFGYRYGGQHQGRMAWDARSNSSTYHRLLVGVEGKLAPWLKADLTIGPDFRRYTADVRGINDKNHTWLHTEGSLTADLSKADSLTLTHKVWHWVSSTGTTAYRDSTYQLTYRHKFSSAFSASVGARASGSDYDAPATRKDWLLGGSLGVKYDFSKQLSLTADYVYVDTHNRLDEVLYPDRDFDQNLLTVAVRWAL